MADRVDYGAIDVAARNAGLTLNSEYARQDGICVPETGKFRTEIGEYIPDKPAHSRIFRHIISGNSSYGHVNGITGEVALRVRHGHNSADDPSKVVALHLTRYASLSRSLREGGVDFVPDSDLEFAMLECSKTLGARKEEVS